MSRGSNNKSGTSGQGTGNQSNQGFGQSEHVRKSGHGRQTTGGKPSLPERKKEDQSSNRNTGLDKE